MSHADPAAAIATARIVPVITLEDPGDAIALADALAAGGLPIAEITFRSDVAAAAIRAIRSERPGFLVGAGTITSSVLVDRAVEAGAQFGVAPGLGQAVVQRAAALGLPFFPGVATPTEIEAAMDAGLRVLKFFPALQLGGPAGAAAVLAAYRHLGVRLLPTGGVTAATCGDYWSVDGVIAVGGSWMVPSSAVRDGDWVEVTRLTAEAVASRPG